MNFIAKMTAIAATGLLLAACTTSSQDNMQTLHGQWDIIRYTAGDGSLVHPVLGSHPDLVIDDDMISGTTGCNNFSGTAAVGDDGSFSVGPLMSTLMGCQPPLATQEFQIHVSLESATNWVVDGESATLSGPNGTTMELARTDTGLAGSDWSITAINNSKGGMQSVLIESDPSMSFKDDQTVAGTSGCNGFGGEYTSAEGDLSFSALFTTEMACVTPDGVMEQESNLYAALDKVSTFTVRGATLTMHDADGATQVTAVRTDVTP